MPANHVKGPAVPLRGWISAVFSLLLLCCTRVEKLDLTRLTLPPGFHIAIFAEAPHARQMAFSPGGVLLVTATSDGTVLAFPDDKHSGRAERMVPVLSGLNAPHGIAFHNGKLYVAEINAVRRYDWDEAQLRAGNEKKIVDLPGSGGGHSTRTLLFTNGKMYVAVGSSCEAGKTTLSGIVVNQERNEETTVIREPHTLDVGSASLFHHLPVGPNDQHRARDLREGCRPPAREKLPVLPSSRGGRAILTAHL